MNPVPSGGARARSGPAPDPGAVRRDRPAYDDSAEWTDLPADGRTKPAPEWPLAVEPSAWEQQFWEQLWRQPQAVEWERQERYKTVATYVRRMSEAGAPGASASLTNVVLRMEDALGLTVLGMRANRWRIAKAGAQQQAPAPRRKAAGSRNRFTVVDGGA